MRLTCASRWLLPRTTDRADDFSFVMSGNLLEHERVGKRIQSSKSRQIHALVREELSDLR